MAKFVIVHGAFQSAAAWRGVVAELERAGHSAHAVDLPGRNAQGPADLLPSLSDYAAAVRAAVEAQGGDVVLVGHSFGGMTISLVAEAIPDALRGLVYVAAYLPRDGESMRSLSTEDPASKVNQDNFIPAPDWSYAEILEGDRAMLFANDADPARADEIARRLLREPLGPMGEQVALSDARFGGIAKACIRTLRDNVISPQFQARMNARAGVRAVRDIDAGHAAAQTDPAGLAGLILELSEELAATRP
ncbi:MAG: alpha/beta fold hydrolase [Porphyrobacter sp.]|nr:alpha/beta fold hydrolase [Porphyrobacter sp.]